MSVVAGTLAALVDGPVQTAALACAFVGAVVATGSLYTESREDRRQKLRERATNRLEHSDTRDAAESNTQKILEAIRGDRISATVQFSAEVRELAGLLERAFEKCGSDPQRRFGLFADLCGAIERLGNDA